jgi:hypothetical protein
MTVVRAFLFGATTLLVLAGGAHADDIWRRHPGEAYDPATYCRWNRTGLPPAQQKICLAYDRAHLPKNYRPKTGQVLTVLLPSCQPGGAISCNDDLYQKVWLRVEATNGAAFKIDMNSIAHLNNGGAEAVVYIIEGTTFDPANLKHFIFDCRGHYMDSDNMGATLYAPPRSVAGQIAALACEGAKDTRLEDASRDDTRGPTPEEYCSGFSPEACDRIKKVVESKKRPAYCRPGFALVGSGLTSEQLRICYVMR